MAGVKVETVVTCTPFTVGGVEGTTSLHESKLELPGESGLRGLWSRTQQIILLLSEIVYDLAGSGAYDEGSVCFTYFLHFMGQSLSCRVNDGFEAYGAEHNRSSYVHWRSPITHRLGGPTKG